jgi:glycosyltransferase involved in cell wall biosynthesis
MLRRTSGVGPSVIGYFTTEYPKVSHTFIRRELQMVERTGMAVRRYALRGWDADIVDPADRAEQQRCFYLLRRGLIGCFIALVVMVLRRPGGVARATRLSLTMMRKTNRTIALHLVSLAEAALLAQRMLGDRIEHLHAHFGTNAAEVAMLAAAIADRPYSFTVHGQDEFDCPKFMKLGLKVARARFVVAITHYCASQLYRWSRHADWQKIHIVHCGVSAAFLAEPAKPVSVPRFVSVARLSREKGQPLLIEAVAILKAHGMPIELVLVGDGEMRAEIERMIDRYRVGDCVRITGWATEAEVRAYLRSARAFLLPSFAEGLPVVVMEALAMGLPVLATNVGAMSELVISGRTGWLFSSGSTAAIVDAVAACLAASPDELARMGEIGRALVREKHDAQREGARLAALFRDPETVPVRA